MILENKIEVYVFIAVFLNVSLHTICHKIRQNVRILYETRIAVKGGEVTVFEIPWEERPYCHIPR